MMPRLGVELGWVPEQVARGLDRKAAPNGAQVAAEAMTYDRARRTDCKAGRSRPGMVTDALRASLP